RRGLFTKDLQQMMTAYGDVQHPHSGSVNTLEDILIDYISELCANALKNGGTGRDGKISADDIRFILRNDENKSARIEELLLVEKDITRVRKL
ncbi:transcription initiation factor IID, 18 kDa subunit, partial [Ramicandelaber brevisporus]